MTKNFIKLIKTEYSFTIGRKGKIRELRIVFDKKDYHHLAGLHYLKDIRILKQDRGKVFDKLSDGTITRETVESSDFYDEYIEGRIAAVDELEKLLDSNEIVLRYNSSANSYTKINFDYILESNNTYIFLKENDGCCRCISLFRKGRTDYTVGHTKWTLLKKIKTDVENNISEELYSRDVLQK